MTQARQGKSRKTVDGHVKTRTDAVVAIYVNYDQRRQNLNDRRATRNAFYVVFLSSLLTAILIAKASGKVVDAIYLHLGSAVGLAFCVLWVWNLTLIQRRIQIMQRVLQELELELPVRPFQMEFTTANKNSSKGSTAIIRAEKMTPTILGTAYLVDLISWIVGSLLS